MIVWTHLPDALDDVSDGSSCARASNSVRNSSSVDTFKSIHLPSNRKWLVDTRQRNTARMRKINTTCRATTCSESLTRSDDLREAEHGSALNSGTPSLALCILQPCVFDPKLQILHVLT